MPTGQKTIEELNQQVTSQTERVMYLEDTALVEAKGTISDLQEDISAKMATITQLEMDLSSTQTSLRELEQRNEELTEQMAYMQENTLADAQSSNLKQKDEIVAKDGVIAQLEADLVNGWTHFCIYLNF